MNRGVVRLVFDVRGDRYVAARELRRSARGGVNVKNARLERLLDRDDIDGDTEVLAADSGVTKAVEELLGLSFEHFTSCVVLPQGEFAEFLHAKPGDRQAILTRLLGLGVYERIAREANREAAAAGDRAALLAEQLGAYADATDEAVARGRRAGASALEALAERVAALLPGGVGGGGGGRRARTTRSPACAAEQARLGALVLPDGLEALDGAAPRRRGTRRRRPRPVLATPRRPTTPRASSLADAPARAPLERARRDHADLAAALAARPGGRRGAGRPARAAEEKAAAAGGRGRGGSHGGCRGPRVRGGGARSAHEAVAERLARERALLAAVRAPAGPGRARAPAARRGRRCARRARATGSTAAERRGRGRARPAGRRAGAGAARAGPARPRRPRGRAATPSPGRRPGTRGSRGLGPPRPRRRDRGPRGARRRAGTPRRRGARRSRRRAAAGAGRGGAVPGVHAGVAALPAPPAGRRPGRARRRRRRGAGGLEAALARGGGCGGRRAAGGGGARPAGGGGHAAAGGGGGRQPGRSTARGCRRAGRSGGSMRSTAVRRRRCAGGAGRRRAAAARPTPRHGRRAGRRGRGRVGAR